MPSLAQVEEQIFVVEGFRVKLTPLLAKTKSFPSYDYTVMAPQRWRVSDWKTARLGAYLALVKAAQLERGDGTPVKGDLQRRQRVGRRRRRRGDVRPDRSDIADLN